MDGSAETLSIEVKSSPYAKSGVAQVVGTNVYLNLPDNTDESWAPRATSSRRKGPGGLSSSS
jgi:hypothetical protein